MKKVLKRILLYSVMVCWPIMAIPAVYALPPSAKAVVIIDPAHGGADHGVKISDKMTEKDLTLKIALLVQKELTKSEPIQVLLTRDKDTDISLQERMKKISTIHPKIMVSVHVNAGFYKTAKGFEIYFPGFKSVKTGKDESSAIINDMTKNRSLNESVRLAQNIQKQLETVFPRESRGLREAPLQILEGIPSASVILEIGFASNEENRKKLNDEKYLQEIARALSIGIKNSL